MRSRRFLFLAAFVSGLMTVALSALPADAAPAHRSTLPSVLAAADPAVTVVPSSGLADGDTVSVTATGVIPSAVVRVIECDVFIGGEESDCPDVTTTASDAAGHVSLSLVLDDVVYRETLSPFSLPVLCRGDICRIFLVVGTGDDVQQVIESDPLEFTGSPATIAIRPATDLHDGQPVHVSGTAYGAEGRTVQIAEKECIELSNDYGRNSPLRVVTTTVTSRGTYAAQYRVRRQEDENSLDCADTDPINNLSCFITVTVLDANGNPDSSFGGSGYYGGYPRVNLSFRTEPPSSVAAEDLRTNTPRS